MNRVQCTIFFEPRQRQITIFNSLENDWQTQQTKHPLDEYALTPNPAELRRG